MVKSSQHLWQRALAFTLERIRPSEAGAVALSSGGGWREGAGIMIEMTMRDERGLSAGGTPAMIYLLFS